VCSSRCRRGRSLCRWPSVGAQGRRRSRRRRLQERVHGRGVVGTVDVQSSAATSRPRLQSILVRAGDGIPVHGSLAASQRRRRGRWNRRPQLVHGLLLRRVNNRPLPQRVPAHQRLRPRVSCHHCASQPNVHGWRDILLRGQPESRRSSNPREVAQAPRKSSVALACFRGHCFQCLARDHKVASYRDPLKCLHCRGSGHLSRHCPARRSLDESSMFGVGN
jgi:hypothetical protein